MTKVTFRDSISYKSSHSLYVIYVSNVCTWNVYHKDPISLL